MTQAPHRASPFLVWLAWMLGIAVMILYVITMAAHARDQGQWKYADPDLKAYFEGLRQPDNPSMSCCGPSDAYWADETDTDPVTGGTIAIITDTRPDDYKLPDGSSVWRPHIAPGTRVAVPANKVRRPAISNPTGHTIIFISSNGTVYCYEPQPLI